MNWKRSTHNYRHARHAGGNTASKNRAQLGHYVASLCLLLLPFTVYGTKSQDHASIQRVALDYIHAQLGQQYQLDVKLGYLDNRLNLAACQQPLEAFFPHHKQQIGRTSIGVRCNDINGWKVFIPANIRAYATVYTAAKPLPRGTIISEQDIKLVKREVSIYRNGVFTSQEGLVGTIVKRPIAQQSVITPGMLKPRHLVKRGDAITILAENNGLVIRVQGEAMGNGQFGQTIEVKNALTRKRGRMSAFGPKRTSASAPHMSAFGGKADMTFCGANFR